MKSETILRILIVADIAFAAALFGIGWFGDPFLTGPLRDYSDARLNSESNSELKASEQLLGASHVLLLVFSVAAWGLLWRGSVRGRLLYTSVLGVSVVLLAFEPPMATSGFIAIIETAGRINVGLILGMLYFSDLKRRYEPNVA